MLNPELDKLETMLKGIKKAKRLANAMKRFDELMRLQTEEDYIIHLINEYNNMS